MSHIKFRPGFYLIIAAYLLIIPVPWLAAWLIAASVHEIFHIVVLKICGFSINGITIGAAGAQIKTDAYPGIKMIMCSVAGPLSGLLLFTLVNQLPRLAICGIIQSIVNMIPLYPFDGGRVFCSILGLLFTDQISKRIYNTVEVIIIISLLLLAMYCTVRFSLGIMPILMMGMFLTKKKYLAKNCASEYNIVNR